MSGQRQPIDLIVMKGKKHLTKSELEKRSATEVKAKSDKVEPPKYLGAKLKKEFREIADELTGIGIMTNLDVDALARFVISRDLYNKLTKTILGDAERYLLDKDALMNQDRLFKQCRSAASDLGLTISSRCRLVMPEKKDDKPINPYVEKFG